MRETDPIEPTWEGDRVTSVPSRVVAGLLRVASGVARRATPHLHRWAAGQRPGLIVAWGPREYAVRGDGIARRRREEEGWSDNPRSNYNEAVERRQQREAPPAVDPTKVTALSDELSEVREQLKRAEANAKGAWTRVRKANAELKAARDAAPPEPGLDLSLEALQAGVAAKMGDDGGSDDGAEVSRDPDALKQELSRVRATLQALDDVQDWGVVEEVDDELYKLHKAVEYKLRNHKASEAKAKLDNLFKA